jgi:hypothetical protein
VVEADEAMGPTRALRRCLLPAVVAGSVAGGLYAALELPGHSVSCLLAVAAVALVVVGRPLAALRGRTYLRAGEIVARRPPARRVVVPVSDVGLVLLRRGLLLEGPALGLRDGRLVVLAAPVRFWFRPDPEFDRALATLCTHVRDQAVVELRPQWSTFRLVGGSLLTALVVAVVLVEPPWASDLWPLRAHARRLPDVCRMFDARARALLPGARVDRLAGEDPLPHAQRHTCQWTATGLARDRTTLVDVGRLRVELELERGVGRISDAAETHREFLRETRLTRGESATWIPRLGDEAELLDLSARDDLTWVAVAVHRANVEEKIDLMYRDGSRQREREAAAVAQLLARLGLSGIHFDHK